jgi:hypothetical protein
MIQPFAKFELVIVFLFVIMKKELKTLFHVMIPFLMILSISCDENKVKVNDDYTGLTKQQWIVAEFNFKSSNTYNDSFNDVDVDVIFKNDDGTEMKVPAFWDGNNIWRVRFAPPILGIWKYTTICTDIDNTGLNNKTGEFKCVKYDGQYLIYKRGFIKTIPGIRYFVYDDKTPFFYLGDTHMNIVANKMVSFKTIINKRVEQGFNVIHSEPLEVKYNLSNGLSFDDLEGFRRLDERFQYVAHKGFVHANSQFFFVSELGYNGDKYSDDYLDKLSRYWVARYSAYPVLWTTAQECDNDFKFGEYSQHNYYDAETNPWKKVAAYIHKYDPYKHPLTAHMEYATYTNASGSAFRDIKGHTWWAVQWSPIKNGVMNFTIPKDFWDNGQGKVTVMYEGCFDYLWTNHFGIRVQGWSAFLTGMYGYGYGAADIWLYNSTYDMNQSTIKDGITITVEQKQAKWTESLEFESAYQMGYMKNFFITHRWWELEPRFNGEGYFDNLGSYYSVATKENDLYVVYFYNTNQVTGRLKGMVNTSYSIQWYNPRDGYPLEENIVSISNGTYEIGPKPDGEDWVLVAKKK